MVSATSEHREKTDMIEPIHHDPERRHDFVLLFDVQDGNPNGDPDADNAPRTDPETMQGLVTDVAIKRKVRDYVDAARGTERRYKIYVQRERVLTEQRERVFGERGGANGKKTNLEPDARDWMRAEFYDIRMFGAVMSVDDFNSGQVRGPMQISFARSIDPVHPMPHAITRIAVETRREVAQATSDGRPQHGTMGEKWTLPYGLYRASGSFNPGVAKGEGEAGVTGADLGLFWEALRMMWDIDRSASRGAMACRGVYVFSHDSPLGNAPAASLFRRVTARRLDGVEFPRAFEDYAVAIGDDDLPAGVRLTRIEE